MQINIFFVVAPNLQVVVIIKKGENVNHASFDDVTKNLLDNERHHKKGVRIRADIVISYSYTYPTFGYREKLKPILVPGQLKYYPSKSRRIRTGTHGYEFFYHV